VIGSFRQKGGGLSKQSRHPSQREPEVDWCDATTLRSIDDRQCLYFCSVLFCEAAYCANMVPGHWPLASCSCSCSVGNFLRDDGRSCSNRHHLSQIQVVAGEIVSPRFAATARFSLPAKDAIGEHTSLNYRLHLQRLTRGTTMARPQPCSGSMYWWMRR
jgi:hypothetical protein